MEVIRVILTILGVAAFFVFVWEAFRGYLVMSDALDLRKKTDQVRHSPSNNAESGRKFGDGVYSGVEGGSDRDVRFFRAFLWFLANLLMAAILYACLMCLKRA